MARLDVEFVDESCGFVAANEDFIEQKIYEKVSKKGYTISSAQEYEQLSARRKGILEWYPFKENATLLELGAGMGALTELFAEKKCIVTSVEVKESRAKIVKKRVQDCANVHVICDNPVLFETDEKFDYIVIHDVWGYIKKYNKCDNAYNIFLDKIRKLLNKDGHFIVIADNRLALKYFSGSIDEYSRKLFVGLNEYKGYSYIKSFDKNEILEILLENGLCPKEIFYVNSDYYFTDKIYTDYALKHVKYVANKYSTTYKEFSFFDEEKVYDAFQRNNIVDKFVDAFVIDCYPSGQKNEKMVYYQIGNATENGVGVFLDNDDTLIRRKFVKEKKQFDCGERICMDDWRKMVLEHKSFDDELRKFVKGNVGFPLVNPVDILMFGEKYCMCETGEDDLQLKEEEKLIQELIGELYEN